MCVGWYVCVWITLRTLTSNFLLLLTISTAKCSARLTFCGRNKEGNNICTLTHSLGLMCAYVYVCVCIQVTPVPPPHTPHTHTHTHTPDIASCGGIPSPSAFALPPDSPFSTDGFLGILGFPGVSRGGGIPGMLKIKNFVVSTCI